MCVERERERRGESRVLCKDVEGRWTKNELERCQKEEEKRIRDKGWREQGQIHKRCWRGRAGGWQQQREWERWYLRQWNAAVDINIWPCYSVGASLTFPELKKFLTVVPAHYSNAQPLPAATAFLPPSGLNIASHHSSQNGRTNKQGMPSCTFNTYWGIISGAGGTESPNTKPCKNN